MNGIRLRSSRRVYDLFQRLAVHALSRRGVITLKPYTGAKRLRKVAVDDVPYPGFGHCLPKGMSHKMNGSLVTLWYRAGLKATKEQIQKAENATKILGIPKTRYTGRLVDVFYHKGTIYALLAGVLERDRDHNRHRRNFRMMNLDDGTLDSAYVSEPTPVKQANQTPSKVV